MSGIIIIRLNAESEMISCFSLFVPNLNARGTRNISDLPFAATETTISFPFFLSRRPKDNGKLNRPKLKKAVCMEWAHRAETFSSSRLCNRTIDISNEQYPGPDRLKYRLISKKKWKKKWMRSYATTDNPKPKPDYIRNKKLRHEIVSGPNCPLISATPCFSGTHRSIQFFRPLRCSNSGNVLLRFIPVFVIKIFSSRRHIFINKSSSPFDPIAAKLILSRCESINEFHAFRVEWNRRPDRKKKRKKQISDPIPMWTWLNQSFNYSKFQSKRQRSAVMHRGTLCGTHSVAGSRPVKAHSGWIVLE